MRNESPEEYTVEEEVQEFLGRGHYERAGEGEFRGYRNGYEGKSIQTGEGAIEIKVPQVRAAKGTVCFDVSAGIFEADRDAT